MTTKPSTNMTLTIFFGSDGSCHDNIIHNNNSNNTNNNNINNNNNNINININSNNDNCDNESDYNSSVKLSDHNTIGVGC